MSDFLIAQAKDYDFADMQISGGDFVLGNDLETAVLVSLFSNRRASNEELAQYARGAVKPEISSGLWIDTYRETPYGSGFWLLLREKKIEETLSRFEEYGNAALGWMLRDGVAQGVNVTAEYDGEKVKLNVVLTRDLGNELVFTYDFAWEQLFGQFAPPGEAVAPLITSTAILWLNPTLPSIGSADPISPWIDVGLAPAENATNATPANRPALIADIANGYAGARFDGVNDTLNAPLVLPLPWTMAPAGRFTKPASKKYILGKAGTGGIYIAPVTGFVGVDLGGTGIEGTVDRTEGSIAISDDFGGTGDNSGAIGGTNYLARDWTKAFDSGTYSADISGGAYNVSIPDGIAGLSNYKVFIPISYDGEFELLFDVTADFPNAQTFGNSRWSTSIPIMDLFFQREDNPALDFKVFDGASQIGTWANGSNAVKITRTAANLVTIYLNGSELKSFTSAATITEIALFTSVNEQGGAPYYGGTAHYESIKFTDKADGTGQDILKTSSLPPMITVQAVADAGTATLYVNGIQEAAGAIGAGTLPSIDVIEAGLAADVPEVQIYDTAQDMAGIAQIANSLEKYL